MTAVPMTTLEQVVATAWHEAFALPAESIDEDFFATGGHSLLAAELAARLEELAGVEVPLTTVFDHPTIRTQAAWLARHATAHEATAFAPARAPAHVAYVPARVIAPLVELGRSTMDRDVVVLALLVALHAQTTRVVLGVPASVADETGTRPSQLVLAVATDGGPSFVELLARTATALGRARAAAAGLGPAPADSPEVFAAPATWTPAGDLELPLEPAFASVFAALVERIAAAPTHACVAAAKGALVDVVEETSAPLSHAQERLWFLEQLQPGTTANHLQQHIRITGPVDHARLERALHALAVRHAALRTRIAGTTEPRQVVAVTPALEHRVVHVAADEASAIAATEHARMFDLARGPLWRSCACMIGPRDHRLYITLHHVIVDALSLHVIFRELIELYGADVAGAPPNLPRLWGSMTTLAEWERSPAGRDRIAADLTYWTEALRGAEPMTLPIDYRRPLVPGVGRHLPTAEIDATVSATLRELARLHGATMNVALIAAAVAFLARMTNRDDVIVVVPAARRDEMSGRGVIGLLLNLLPLRVNVAGDPPFSEIVSRTQTAFYEGMRHRDAPFERVVAALGLPREPGRQPLFDVIINIVPGIAATERAGAVFEIEAAVGSAQPCDLVLGFTTRGARGVTMATRCRDDLFAPATATRFVRRLETLLRAAIASPATPLSQLPLLPPDERELVVETWNRTYAPRPDVTVHAHVCAALARNPDAIAVTQHGRTLTARALAQRSAVLAQQLRARGVRAQTRVGVIVPPGPDLAIAALGTLRAGCIYVPLDGTQPAARLERLRQEVELVIDLDAVARTEGMTITERVPDVSPETAAYAVFTSGSTGRPKGVETSHRGLVNQIDWFAIAFPWQRGEIAVLRSSPAFVDSMWELFGPLAAGVPLAIATSDEMRDTRLLAALVQRERVSRMIVVPSLLRALLELGAGRENFLETLRLWLATSEELAPALVQQFFAARPGQRLINLYGASETADQVAAYEVTGVDPVRTPIGTPIAN
ncbi:MAG: condensation domain-containing protein, partial [Kofleriaceae bacterium]